MRRLSTIAAMALMLAGCVGTAGPGTSPPPSRSPAAASDLPGDALRYVALGDSYTIGTGLPRRVDRWPNQLVRALRPQVSLVANLAVSGNGTLEVIEEQLPVLEDLAPVDLVTLQVGVNDIVIPRISDEEYRASLITILDGRDGPPASAARAGILDIVTPDRVLLVTTPDFTLVPRNPYARPGDSETVARFNDILRELAAERGIRVVDISPISDLVADDPTLLTDDDRHPSAKQYAGWVELIAPAARSILDAEQGRSR